MAESEEELKNLLMKVKEESEKAGLTQCTVGGNVHCYSHFEKQCGGFSKN